VKKYGYLFDKICTYENLYRAYLNARSKKGWYAEVKVIARRPFYYLAALKWMFETGNYHTSEYESFIKNDGKKERELYKLPFFPDRIAQWAIIQVLMPTYLNFFTDDSYSSIPKKGIHAVVKKLRKALDSYPEEMQYCLELDAKKFYLSIPHYYLLRQYCKKYKDKRLIYLIRENIMSISTCPATEENINYYFFRGSRSRANNRYPPPELFFKYEYRNDKEYLQGYGIPIGNLFSQYHSNFYMTQFDHWVKEKLGVKHYYRYMDDIRIFARTKEELWDIYHKVKRYLDKNLAIRLKDNYQIFPTFVRGVDFVGYRFFKDFTLLRKSTCIEMKRKMTKILHKVTSGKMMSYHDYCCINSYNGWLKHCDSIRLKRKYIEPLIPYCEIFYMECIKGGGINNENVSEYKKCG
jgi:hypothetical protein